MPLTFSRVVIPVALVPLDELKTHLRVTDTDHDADVTVIGAAAQDAIVAYLKAAADATWTATTAPRPVRHAIKLLAADYYEHRGDDAGGGRTADEKTWQAIARLLAMYRDPTLA